MSEQPDPGRTRRSLLRLAGAAAVGGAASALVARPASAIVGAMQYGTINNSDTAATTLTCSGWATFDIENTAHGVAVFGHSNGIGMGVAGEVDGDLGYGVYGGGGAAQLYLQPKAGSGVPSSGLHNRGELHFNNSGLHVCVSAGTPGVWRSVATTVSSGAFVPISPARVYDSRKPMPMGGPLNGPLATGSNRLIPVIDKRDPNTYAVTLANVVPAGATAIAYNLTVVGTVGGNGFLAVNEGGNNAVAASVLNWSAAGLTIANAAVVKISTNRYVTVICGGTGTSTHFIVDVLGYYL